MLHVKAINGKLRFLGKVNLNETKKVLIIQFNSLFRPHEWIIGLSIDCMLQWKENVPELETCYSSGTKFFNN